MADCKKQIMFLLISITKLCWETVPAEVSKTSSSKEQRKKKPYIKKRGEKRKEKKKKEHFWILICALGGELPFSHSLLLCGSRSLFRMTVWPTLSQSRLPPSRDMLKQLKDCFSQKHFHTAGAKIAPKSYWMRVLTVLLAGSKFHFPDGNRAASLGEFRLPEGLPGSMKSSHS